MYIIYTIMYMMKTISTPDRRNKHFILDQTKLRKAQKALGTRTETETIEAALERVVTEAEKNKRAWEASDRLLKSAKKGSVQIDDVFGRLEGR